jgi:hypothetical protein
MVPIIVWVLLSMAMAMAMAMADYIKAYSVQTLQKLQIR